MNDDGTPHDVASATAAAAVDYRQARELQRAHASRRYSDHLASAFRTHGVPDPDVQARIALDALTAWRRNTGDDVCGCSCHPRLPDTDLHDYGFACP